MDVDAAASTPLGTTLLECRLCDLSFNTAEEKRQHAKSEWHVYKIRCRVATPGTTVCPPGSGPKPCYRPRDEGWRPRSKSRHADEESYDEESEGDTASEKDLVEFVAEECLFCNQTSGDFDENLSHMHQEHSLVIPFQSSLVVDLQTLIWFLHMVIFGYQECICCGKRRRTVEAVQQHMMSTGHCRLDMANEITSFYDMDSLGQQTERSCSRLDDRTLRLPSGKLLGHRSYVNSTTKSRPRDKSHAGPSALLPFEENDATSQTLVKMDQRQQALTARISQLRTGDQMSLTHLPEAQQRSLLVSHKKGLDEARRAERRKGGRVENVGNKTAIHTKYYKQEVPVYMGG